MNRQIRSSFVYAISRLFCSGYCSQGGLTYGRLMPMPTQANESLKSRNNLKTLIACVNRDPEIRISSWRIKSG